jgi:hypothetical protein
MSNHYIFLRVGGPSTGEVESGFPGGRRAFKYPLNQAAIYDGGEKKDFQTGDRSFSFW